MATTGGSSDAAPEGTEMVANTGGSDVGAGGADYDALAAMKVGQGQGKKEEKQKPCTALIAKEESFISIYGISL